MRTRESVTMSFAFVPCANRLVPRQVIRSRRQLSALLHPDGISRRKPAGLHTDAEPGGVLMLLVDQLQNLRGRVISDRNHVSS